MVAKNKDREKYINDQITAGSTKNRTALGKEYDEEQRLKKLPWDQKVQELFGAYAYLLSPTNVFGADVTDVLRQAAQQEWSAARFQAAIENTAYFKTSSVAVQSFDKLKGGEQASRITKTRDLIISRFGTIFKSDQDLIDVATTATRRGLTDDALINYVYSEAFTRQSGTVASTKDTDAIRQAGEKYFMKVPLATERAVLTGQTTEEDFLKTLRSDAVVQYPHLADLIERGYSLSDIASPYKRVAAQTLDLGENDIDFTSPKFMRALDQTKDGRRRTISEWETELRTNSEYGYSFTKQANQDATNIGLAIARAFGKVG